MYERKRFERFHRKAVRKAYAIFFLIVFVRFAMIVALLAVLFYLVKYFGFINAY